MKTKFILALALLILACAAPVNAGCGWYLLVPPKYFTVLPPIEQWKHDSSHDSAAHCQATKNGWIRDFKFLPDGAGRDTVAQYSAARCIPAEEARWSLK